MVKVITKNKVINVLTLCILLLLVYAKAYHVYNIFFTERTFSPIFVLKYTEAQLQISQPQRQQYKTLWAVLPNLLETKNLAAHFNCFQSVKLNNMKPFQCLVISVSGYRFSKVSVHL